MTKAGVYLPVGIQGEYAGRDATYMWDRVVYLAKLAEKLGFPAIRVPDHLMNCRADDEAPTLEVFGVLSAVAMVTSKATLGQSVLCAAFRNPAYLMKQVTTLDAISGGRAELGLGAGWWEPEWRSFGYGFPPVPERMRILRETLEVATRMLNSGRASFEGSWITHRKYGLRTKGISRTSHSGFRRRQWAKCDLETRCQILRRAQPLRSNRRSGPGMVANHGQPLRRDRSRSLDAAHLRPDVVEPSRVRKSGIGWSSCRSFVSWGFPTSSPTSRKPPTPTSPFSPGPRIAGPRD